MLHIEGVIDADKGDYQCTAYNDYGAHSESIKLRVKGSIYFIRLYYGIEINKMLNKNRYISCFVAIFRNCCWSVDSLHNHSSVREEM